MTTRRRHTHDTPVAAQVAAIRAQRTAGLIRPDQYRQVLDQVSPMAWTLARHADRQARVSPHQRRPTPR